MRERKIERGRRRRNGNCIIFPLLWIFIFALWYYALFFSNILETNESVDFFYIRSLKKEWKLSGNFFFLVELEMPKWSEWRKLLMNNKTEPLSVLFIFIPFFIHIFSLSLSSRKEALLSALRLTFFWTKLSCSHFIVSTRTLSLSLDSSSMHVRIFFSLFPRERNCLL